MMFSSTHMLHSHMEVFYNLKNLCQQRPNNDSHMEIMISCGKTQLFPLFSLSHHHMTNIDASCAITVAVTSFPQHNLSHTFFNYSFSSFCFVELAYFIFYTLCLAFYFIATRLSSSLCSIELVNFLHHVLYILLMCAHFVSLAFQLCVLQHPKSSSMFHNQQITFKKIK